MTQPQTMARRGSGPPFIWLPADNCPMTPQVLNPLTQSTAAAYASPQRVALSQPLKARPLLVFFGSSGFFGLSGFSGETIGPDNQTDQTDRTNS